MKTNSLEQVFIPYRIPDAIAEILIIENKETISDLVEEIPEILENYNKHFAPSFDDLNVDMDVLDLVSCSKKLLNSVSTTLEHIKNSPEEPEVEIDNELFLPLVEEKVVATPESQSNENITQFLKECTIVQRSIQKSILNTKILLPEGSIRQWARELVVAIDSLHSNGVILG